MSNETHRVGRHTSTLGARGKVYTAKGGKTCSSGVRGGALLMGRPNFCELVLVLTLPIVVRGVVAINIGVVSAIVLNDFNRVRLSNSSLTGSFVGLFRVTYVNINNNTSILDTRFCNGNSCGGIGGAITVVLHMVLSITIIYVIVSLFFPRRLLQVCATSATIVRGNTVCLQCDATSFTVVTVAVALALVLQSVRSMGVPLCTSVNDFFIGVFFG